MAFTEDLSVFFDLQGFGVPVVHEGVTGVGILDMPSEIMADGVVLSTDYKLTVRSGGVQRILKWRYGDRGRRVVQGAEPKPCR
jgi:hypothetical protein